MKRNNTYRARFQTDSSRVKGDALSDKCKGLGIFGRCTLVVAGFAVSAIVSDLEDENPTFPRSSQVPKSHESLREKCSTAETEEIRTPIFVLHGNYDSPCSFRRPRLHSAESDKSFFTTKEMSTFVADDDLHIFETRELLLNALDKCLGIPVQ